MKTSNVEIEKNSNSISFLLAGIFAITFYFHIKAEDPFNTPKLIILLLMGSWLMGHIIKFFWRKKSKLTRHELFLILILILFLSSQIISLYLSSNFIVGLIGDNQRRNGVLSYIALSVILLFTALHIRHTHSLKIVKFTILNGLLLSLYGLVQFSGRDFVSWDNPYNRIILTIGNPNFASALLAVMTLIAILALFLKSISPLYKLISVFVAVAAIFCILQSESRQGLLVVFFGFLFNATTYVYLNYPKYKSLILLFSLGASIFVVFGMLNQGPLSSVLYKDSVSVRGFYWRAAFEMFKNYPLFGVGPDNYGSYFKEFREQEYVLRYGYDITSTNAHNTFLQFFSTGGALVGVSYMALLVFIFFAGVSQLRQSMGEERKVALLLLSAWVGFQAQSLISIDNVGISIWGWLLGGAILGLYFEKIKKNQELTPLPRKKNSVRIELFQPLVSSLIVVPTIAIAVLLHSSETHTYNVRALAAAADTEGKNLALNFATSVVQNPLSDSYNKFKVSDAMYRLGFTVQAVSQIKDLYLEDKRNTVFLWWLAEYEHKSNNYLESIKYLNKIEVVDPWNAEVYFAKGRIYKLLGNKSDMIEMLNEIKRVAPSSEIYKSASAELI